MTDEEIIDEAIARYENDDVEMIGLYPEDDRGVRWPVVERVEAGAWVLARVWVPIDEET